MNFDEAYALFVLDNLASEEIVKTVNDWLDMGIYTPSLGEIVYVKSPIMSDVGPLFESAMEELQISKPTKFEAARALIRISLERITTRNKDPLIIAEFLYWKVHHKVEREFPDKEFLGDNLGLQDVFCWLREIWDCRDGSRILYYSELPRDQAEEKFFEHLRESASDWLSNNTQPVAGGDATR